MKTSSSGSKGLLEIRKYSNRRYYDSTKSRHLTLEEIRDLVQEGYDVRVVDSKTGTDITPKILTQIILDLDSVKLDLFPAPLLSQLIRANDQLVKGFYERFFGQALEAFLHYQRLMEAQLAPSSMFPSMFPSMPAWSPALFGSTASAAAPKAEPEVGDPSGNADVSAKLAALQQQLEELKGHVKPGAKRASRKTAAKKRRRTGGT